MPAALWIIVIVVAIVALVVVLVSVSRGRHDAVDSFRRQIDALSPEARRPVVDQVQSVTERTDRPAEDRSAANGAADGERGGRDAGDDAPDEGSDPHGA